MAAKQMSLFPKKFEKELKRTIHGGADSKGHRKNARPLHAKKWIHLILKSDKAKGKYSLLGAAHQTWIETFIRETGGKFGVRVGDYANVGNHLHIKVKPMNRNQFARFLKAIAGRIASRVTGARRGRSFGRFWQGLAYTRVLTSGYQELRLKGYFKANRAEADYGYEFRENFLKKFNAWINQVRNAKGIAPPARIPRPAWI